MQPERRELRGMRPLAVGSQDPSIVFATMNVAAMGLVPTQQWAEIYRLAYERTVEALRPTRYDRAMAAVVN